MGREGGNLYCSKAPQSMASNQVRDSCSTHAPHGYSKSQMCFFKILRVISSVPPSPHSKQQPHPTPKHDPSHHSPTTTGIDVDLNLRLRSVWENAESECSPSDSSAIEQTKAGDQSVQVSELTDTKETEFEDQIGGEDREGKEEGIETVPFEGKTRGSYNNCLDLLIEAAKLVFEEPSGESGLSSEFRTQGRNEGTGILDLEVNKEAMKKGKQRWMVVDFCNEMNDTSPVVRSKRGRSQALPFRFRDSIVEPLKRLGRPQRSSTTTTASRKRLIWS